MDRTPAGGIALEDHSDAEGWLMQFGAGFELDAGVGNEERDRCVPENVDLQILDLLREHLLQMFGKGCHISLNGGPTVGWLFHLLCDIDQRLMLRVPDGCNLLWVQMEKALAIGLDQSGNRVLSVLLVRF